MKTKHLFIKNKSYLLSYFLLALCIVPAYFTSCKDDIEEDAYSTFTGETVASFCQNNSQLSTFSRIIEESGNGPLLSLYGHFTCFVPTDSAFENYFNEHQIAYENLTKDDKRTIVFNHLIRHNATEYISETFQQGPLPTPSMNERFMVISFGVDSLSGVYKQTIYVNKYSRILYKDNEVHNGVVHVINHLIEPSQDYLLTVMKEQDDFKLFAEAMELTHLGDSILQAYDPNYIDPAPGVDLVMATGYPARPVHTNRYGYTIFAEPDAVLNSEGIYTVEDLVKLAQRYYGNENLNDYTNRNNPLNKYISYHMLNRQMGTNAFVYQGRNTAEYAMNQRHEYYETMLDKRLMEIKAGNQINTLKDGTFVGVDEPASNIEGMNGYIHALTKILVYDERAMTGDVLNKRIRVDAYSIPPQLTNNNIRWKNIGDNRTISNNLCGEYLQLNAASQNILWGAEYWDAHQADEMKVTGWYDFTLRLPPVPPGTYEIRFGYNAVTWRGIAQIFIDGQICGIPVDLTKTGDSPDVGYVKDSETIDGGKENDKMMRNRGYMKGAQAARNADYGHTLRQSQNNLRVIVGTFTFDTYDYHYFRAKNVDTDSREFQLDYFEYCPVSYLDKETID